MSPKSYQRFVDKAAIVTGGGMGIGAAVARALASEGAGVAVVDRDAEAAKRVASDIESAGGHAIALIGNVARADDARGFVNSTAQRFDAVDLLVNNAGVVIYGETTEFTEQDWDTVVDTNLKSQFLMAKYAIPEMRKRSGGAIVNLASVQAQLSQRQVAAYAASKGGVVTLTKTLALDHATDNIRVNCVLPGSVRTPMLARAANLEPGDPEETIARWGRVHPRGTVIEPEEIAAVVLFLLSDDASAVTGTGVFADAGLSAGLPF
jgi:NAD(P)-dependent dehydrogenase (short-subunit alcohol dehydrogenase family)